MTDTPEETALRFGSFDVVETAPRDGRPIMAKVSRWHGEYYCVVKFSGGAWVLDIPPWWYQKMPAFGEKAPPPLAFDDCDLIFWAPIPPEWSAKNKKSPSPSLAGDPSAMLPYDQYGPGTERGVI